MKEYTALKDKGDTLLGQIVSVVTVNGVRVTLKTAPGAWCGLPPTSRRWWWWWKAWLRGQYAGDVRRY